MGQYGSLVGVPITNYRGDALIEVACIGSPLFSPSEGLSPIEPPGLEGGPVAGFVPSIGKSCWLGWFEFTGPLAVPPGTLAYTPPGNCSLWVNKSSLETGSPITDASNVKFANWVQAPAGGTVDNIEALVATITDGPAVAYWDSRTWPRYPVLRPGDWLAIQAYCRVNEAPQDFEINMRAVIAAAPASNPICLVCQCYTSNTDNTSGLIALVPVYARLARDFNNVTMLLVFSDQGRATGLVDHPEVLPYWTDLYRGIPTAPVGLSAAPATMSRYWKTPYDIITEMDTSPSSGAPLPAGRVKVIATVTVPGLMAQTTPTTPPTTTTGGGTPAPPGGGSDTDTNLPETAPNMFYILQRVYGDGSQWNLAEGFQTAPNGRGAFTEAAVTAMHDVDARWGHIKKNPGQNQYNGHAVDAVVYKNPDGVTGEIFDIVSGGAGKIQWVFDSRDAAGLSKWYYPA